MFQIFLYKLHEEQGGGGEGRGGGQEKSLESKALKMA